MRITLTLFFLCFLYSCELRYEDNERLLYKGEIKGLTDLPLADISVEVYATNFSISDFQLETLSRENSFEDINLIGQNVSNEQGTFNVTTISPKNEVSTVIVINGVNSSSYITSKPSLFYLYDSNRNSNRATGQVSFTVPNSILPDKLTFELILERSTTNNDTLSYSVSYPKVNKIARFPPDPQQPESPNFLFNELLPSIQQQRDTLETVDGDIIKFQYTLKNRTILSSGEEEIKVTAQNNSYVFRF